MLWSAASMMAVVAGSFAVYSFAPAENTKDEVESIAPTKRYVKTKFRCSKSNCQCSGYWGIKHDNGTYEGPCGNSDGFGHTCKHGPEHHGLKKW